MVYGLLQELKELLANAQEAASSAGSAAEEASALRGQEAMAVAATLSSR